MNASGPLRIALLCTVALVVVATGPTSGATAAGTGSVLIVGDTADADFASIQAAVDAATAGDTIRVQPGVYHESVTVDVPLTLVAPRGATLDGSTLEDSADGIALRVDGEVVVAGFTITGYEIGIQGDGNDAGDWVVRNTTVKNASWMAVSAGGTTSRWQLRNVTIANTETGIYARSADGAWRVTDTTIRNVSEGHGVDALVATGPWVLDNVTIRDVSDVGVGASHTQGDWRIVNSTISGATIGVGATGATGNWTVSGSVITNITVSERHDYWQPQLTEGAGIDASRTNGSWRVRNSRFANVEEAAIVAEGANPAGNATGNSWDGTASQNCVGNVSCGRAVATDQSPTPSTVGATGTTVGTATASTTGSRTSITEPPATSAQPTASPSESVGTQPRESDTRSRVPGRSPRLGTLVGLVVAVVLIGHRRQ